MWGTGGGAGHHGFDIALIEDLRQFIVHGHLTFTAYVASYNARHSSSLDSHSLVDNFFALYFMRYMSSFGLVTGMELSAFFTRAGRRNNSAIGMEAKLLSFLPVIRSNFRKFWGSHFCRPASQSPALFDAALSLNHPTPFENLESIRAGTGEGADLDAFAKYLIPASCESEDGSVDSRSACAEGGDTSAPVEAMGCGHDNCCKVMGYDGHMKNTRSCCPRQQAFLRDSPEIKGLYLQCPNRPM